MLFKSIQKFIEQHTLILNNSTVIIGLSGGPDSLFLLHALASMREKKNMRLVAAHLDHEWRTNSHKDAEFCRQAALALNIPFVTQKISELSPELLATITFNGSREEHARHIRRSFFSQVKKTYNADLIALGHHAQDQQETFFIRLIRGSGLTGLTGMLPQKNEYIRPLLQTNKADIIAYLEQHDITYLTDPSNASDEFLRNRIRNSVLPALNKSDTRFEKNMLTTITRLQETEKFLDTLSTQLFETHSVYKNNNYHINHSEIISLDPIMIYRILMHWLVSASVPFTPTHKFFNEIIRFLKQPGSKSHHMHPTWSIVKKKQLTHIIKHS